MKQPVKGAQTANQKIAGAAGTVMIAFIISNLVGVVRGVVITDAFGTSAELDSFNAANRIAELLFNIVAGGALGSAFIPSFTGFLAKEDRAGAWRLASGVINMVFCALVLISVMAWIFAPQIVQEGLFLLVPESDPVQEALTISLLRIMLPSVVIFGISGLVMGILNAHKVFLIPSIAPAMYSLGMILGTWLLPEALGIRRLAYGVVGGALMHLLVQLPRVWRLRERAYHLYFGLRDRAVIRVFRLMGPRLLGVAVVQLNFIVNTIIALGQPEGSVSAVTLAFALMLMPQQAVAQSAAIASLPTFSEQVALGKLDEMRSSLASTLRAVLILAIPASVGLILLRTPIVALLYQRGEFTARSTELVAWALLWYAAGLVGHALVEVLSRAFYALHDTRTPVTVGVIAMGLNIGFSLLFAQTFERMGWMPHGGLALANSLATGLESLALVLLMRKRLKGLEGGYIWKGVGISVLGTGLMATAVLGMQALLGERSLIVVTFGALGVGVVVYVGLMWALKMPELLGMVRVLVSRIKRD
ncbi:MAG: murein biosynthesis integral membrane protein MurJ [Chloroflexota bacterium]|jgi:putative peptidoglycan lipid II flippase|nr:murein biosynthesis integral membrane protein MurJ [Chloroflexota bacterium]